MECRVCRTSIDATPVPTQGSDGQTVPTVICRYCGTDNTPGTDYPTGIAMVSVIERDRRVTASMKRAKK